MDNYQITILCEQHQNLPITHFSIKQIYGSKYLQCSECFRTEPSYGQQNTLPIETLYQWIEKQNEYVQMMINHHSRSFLEIQNQFHEIQQKIKQLYLINLEQLQNLNYYQINNLIKNLQTLKICKETFLQNCEFRQFYQQLVNFKSSFLSEQQCSYQGLQTYKNMNMELDQKIVQLKQENQILKNEIFNLQNIQTNFITNYHCYKKLNSQKFNQIQQIFQIIDIKEQSFKFNLKQQQALITSIENNISIKENEMNELKLSIKQENQLLQKLLTNNTQPQRPQTAQSPLKKNRRLHARNESVEMQKPSSKQIFKVIKPFRINSSKSQQNSFTDNQEQYFQNFNNLQQQQTKKTKPLVFPKIKVQQRPQTAGFKQN